MNKPALLIGFPTISAESY